MTQTGSQVVESLTQRQRQILVRVCDGMANKEIAAELGLQTQVVKNYMGGILTATGMGTRAELIVFAFRHQMIQCPCMLYAAEPSGR
jgi:DNA-binding NarL/FixJ family response regulator